MAGLRTSWDIIGLGKGCWGQFSEGCNSPGHWVTPCLWLVWSVPQWQKSTDVGEGANCKTRDVLGHFYFFVKSLFCLLNLVYVDTVAFFFCFCNLMDSKFNENF